MAKKVKKEAAENLPATVPETPDEETAIEQLPDLPPILGNKENLKAMLARADVALAFKEQAVKHFTQELIVRMLIMATVKTPALLQCSTGSLLRSAMLAAKLGLDCTGDLGEGYLVPFYNGKTKRKECQFIPGYQGLISLARRSGEIARIESRAVYVNDIFDLVYGLEPILTHKPAWRDRGDILLFYGIAELTDGSKQVEAMTLEEVQAIQERSRAKSGPWVTDFVEMGRKTVIRRIFKYLPKSTEDLRRAIVEDDRQFDLSEPAPDKLLGNEGLKDRLLPEPEPEDETPVAPVVDAEPETEVPVEPTEPTEPTSWHCENCGIDSEELDDGKCPKCLSMKLTPNAAAT